MGPKVSVYLPVVRVELAHQHAQVLRVPHPVLTAEVLQQADGLVETVEDAHHPGVRQDDRNDSDLLFLLHDERTECESEPYCGFCPDSRRNRS